MSSIETILAILTIMSLVGAGLRWYIQSQIEPIHEAVCDIRSETKTNGGSSMRDEIKAIKKEQEVAREIRRETNTKIDQTNEKIDNLYKILIDYISRNNK